MVVEAIKLICWAVIVAIIIIFYQDSRAERDRVKYMYICGEQHFDPQQCAFLDLLSRVGRP
jgi:hypothetical protein